MVFTWLLPTILMTVTAIADEPVCKNTGQIVGSVAHTKMWIEISRQATLAAARGDLKGFCEWNRMDRAFTGMDILTEQREDFRQDRWLGIPVEEYRDIKSAGYRDEAAFQMNPTGKRVKSIWQGSLMGHPYLKSNVQSNFIVLCGAMSSMECAGKIASAIENQTLPGNYELPAYKHDYRTKLSKTKFAGGCVFVDPLNTMGCVAAGKDLMDLLRSQISPSDAFVTAGPLIKKALSDRRITAALQRTSAKMWRRIEQKQFNKGDNIFTELKTELAASGFSEIDAKKSAIQILGAISTGGPNFNYRINVSEISSFPEGCIEKGCNLNGVYMSAIAEGLVNADTLKMQGDPPSLYSLPKGADFPCDIGKGYHFWLPAALVDTLIEKGHSPRAARAAVFVSSVGYQLGEGAISFRGAHPLTRNRFGAMEAGIVMDLNLAAAGGAFGASLVNSSGDEKLPLRDGLLKMLEESSTTPATDIFSTGPELTPAQIVDWANRVSVPTAFKFYP